MKILIFGKFGNIGSALAEELHARGDFFIQAGKEEVDFRDGGDAALRFLDNHQPTVVINAAAFTKVDLAEQMRDEAVQINAVAPGHIAGWCAKNKASLFHYSTDYVFDGDKDGLWRESDQTNPLNVYGKSKLEGEKRILDSGAHALILRTSWLYAPRGMNFYMTMLKLGQEREQIRVVDDQIGSPSSARDIATATLEIIRSTHGEIGESGIFHVCNDGYVSWYQFACEIFKLERQFGRNLKVEHVTAIQTSDYPTPAKRPLNSKMDTSKIKKTFGIHLNSWDESLAACILQNIKLSSLGTLDV
ncbi:MAG: dTDP-4-dehydrorhamnose reductase [Bdellovibrionaceae bacterium]|nr:dTDP-4-dehydrorhamnose reductase [Pseudobdellovibrionaceae bacterium]